MREWPRLGKWLEVENRNARRLGELTEAAKDAGWRADMTPAEFKSVRELAGLTLQNLVNWRNLSEQALSLRWNAARLHLAKFFGISGY